MRLRQPPARAGALGPGEQRGQVGLGDAEAACQRRHLQQVGDLAEARALLRQPEQPFQRHQQRVPPACAEVGDAPGDVPRMTTRQRAEDGADGRREARDVGHHHDHLARRQRLAAWRLREQVQQLVVQDLDLALRAVRDVEDDGTVAGGRRPRRGALLGQRHEVAHGGLHLRQQRVARRLVEQVQARQRKALACQLGVVEGIELAHEVARLAAPRGQQRVAVRVQFGGVQRGQVAPAAQRLAAALGAQQLAARDQVGPVEAAGVGHRQQHLHVA